MVPYLSVHIRRVFWWGFFKSFIQASHKYMFFQPVVEHSTANPKVPGLIPGPVSYRVMDYDEACFKHLTPGVFQNFPKAVGV